MKQKKCEGNLNEFLLVILSPPIVLLYTVDTVQRCIDSYRKVAVKISETVTFICNFPQIVTDYFKRIEYLAFDANSNHSEALMHSF